MATPLPTFPAFAAVRGDVGENAPNDVARTTWDDGAQRQARIYTRGRRTWRVVALIPGERKAEWDAWADAWAHRNFPWSDPDGVTRNVTVQGGVGGIDLVSYHAGGGRRGWEATLTLEGDV